MLRFLRSAGFRFALLFAVVFSAAAAGFAFVLWFATAGSLDRQTDAALRTDALGLMERWREGGPGAVADAIAERLAADVENHAIYMLLDPQGRRVAGNLDRWPASVGQGPDGPWSFAFVAREGTSVEARIYAINLDDYRLIAGRDIEEKQRLRDTLAEGIAWSAIAASLFAFLGAAVLRRALANRLRPATRTAEAIAAGDLSRRVPSSGRADEFDRLGESMNTMLDRIDRLMEGVRGVSDSIAHDLRTPIARARAKLEEALADTSEPGALRAAIEQAIADLDHITRVFGALLRIAEAEAGARRAAFATLDLAAVLADVAEFYGAVAESRGQALETDLPERLDLVGDRELLAQAVGNLIDNALKFTPPGGRVLLSARILAREGVEVSVADSGPGLPLEDRARAGERFFRADASRGTPGSGLGLSLVRAVAHLHGGDLLLDDAEPGREPPGLRASLRLGTA
ncbi:HAMP domain-containing histidine kinase [Roseomonas sp. PWR1]|uniref:histidine kinase n=2 Tax=Roseomonas nitratireducens TaxID=2820810 RepID=A0ABS4AMA1_9PROT|nr:HAMP domain-containing sensor histidine kinase [Neoroseomonas nitratireducens]MBP0462496.1 HAMP domain-containing histidine kinase [Neoroseomonas nitratireducens]